MPSIVIVTPVLNGVRFIGEMMASVSAQSDGDWVHYIVDGGSTDGTRNVVRAAMLGEPRRRLIEEPDQGMYDAVFRGFDCARSDGFSSQETICFWLNADDLMMPWALAVMRAAFAQTGAAWMTALPCFWDAHGRLQLLLPYVWYPRWAIRLGLFQDSALGWIQQESSFFTRDLLDRLPAQTINTIRRTRLAGDFLLWRAFAQSCAPHPLPLPVSGFRKHDANASNARRNEYYAEVAASGVWIVPRPIGRLIRLACSPFALLKSAAAIRRQARTFLR